MQVSLNLNKRHATVEVDAQRGGIVGGSWDDTSEFLTDEELQALESKYPEYLCPKKIAEEIWAEEMFMRGFKGIN